MLGSALKHSLGCEAWGVEPVAEMARSAASRLDRVLPCSVEMSMEHLPENYFDTIICADVLEHLVDPWQVLRQLRERLAPGGELIASLPNVRNWSIVRRLLEGRWEYEDAGILDQTHLRFFTWQECIRMFERAGFTITHAEPKILPGDDGIPVNIVTALEQAGLDVSTLQEESRHYQMVIVSERSLIEYTL